MAIYQRASTATCGSGHAACTDAKVWEFLGAGRDDEPESLGAITLASREELDNLIFVVKLQFAAPRWPGARNDRSFSNWKSAFRGARGGSHQGFVGQRVGSHFEQRHRRAAGDESGMGELVDGEYQKLWFPFFFRELCSRDF